MDEYSELDQLYMSGVAAFRAARWREAIDTLSRLHDLGGASVETEALLADAQLKLEIDRAHVPVGKSLPKKRRYMLVPLALAAGIVLVGLAVAWYSSHSASNTSQAAAPVLGSTVTQQATAGEPTQKAILLPAAADSLSGTVLVRWAADQPVRQPVQNVEFILDASGSMLGRIGTQRRIDLAHTALEQLIKQIPETTHVALRTYGRRRSNDCTDAELVRPFGPLDRAAFIDDIRATIPVPESRTPLALSLQAVAQDLRTTKGEIMIVLVSDGDETCGGDPARAAEQLHQENPNIRVSVVGFAVGPAAWKARLQATAQRGGGAYFDASDSTELASALHNAVTPTYQLLDNQGTEIFSGMLGNSVVLPSGRYQLTLNGTVLQNNPIEVEDGRTMIVDVREAAGTISAGISNDSSRQ